MRENLRQRRGLSTFTMAGCWVSAPEFRLLGYRALWGLWQKNISLPGLGRGRQARALVREAGSQVPPCLCTSRGLSASFKCSPGLLACFSSPSFAFFLPRGCFPSLPARKRWELKDRTLTRADGVRFGGKPPPGALWASLIPSSAQRAGLGHQPGDSRRQQGSAFPCPSPSDLEVVLSHLGPQPLHRLGGERVTVGP